MELPILQDIVIIFGLAIIVSWICHRLRIPIIVSMLITGIVCGPYGFKLIDQLTQVEMLAKVGIVFLLFTIGLEFSLKRLLDIKRYFFIGGILQVALTVLTGFLTAKFIGRPSDEALLLGFLLSMSSTAIVLKALDAQGSTTAPQGQLSLGILIFQDIIAIPMVLLVGSFGKSEQALGLNSILQFVFGFAVIAIVFIAAIKIVPMILYYVAKVRSRELFSLAVLTICFLVAWVASSIGLSLAIGAFLAGLVISESEYRHEAAGHVLPFQDIFSSLFFVSIGMLLDIHFAMENFLLIFTLAPLIMLMKSVVVAFAAFCMGSPLRVMILSGLALSQIGEFSFVLVKAGIDSGLGSDYLYQLFLAVAVLTMALTTPLIQLSPKIAMFFSKFPLPEWLKQGYYHYTEVETPKRKDHLIIVGFGVAGRNVAYAAKERNLPYLILEMNPETVRTEKKKGEPIHFGDATHDIVLHHLDIENAKVVAVMINDPHAVGMTIKHIRKMNEHVYIIVRTRYLKEVNPLLALGADEVISEEVGTSIEIFTSVLKQYGASDEWIDRLKKKLIIG